MICVQILFISNRNGAATFTLSCPGKLSVSNLTHPPTQPTKPNKQPNHKTNHTTQSQRHVANNKWSVLLFKHKITICCWHAGFGIVSRHLTSHKLSHSQHTTKTTRIQANYESTKSAVERAEATKYCAQ